MHVFVCVVVVSGCYFVFDWLITCLLYKKKSYKCVMEKYIEPQNNISAGRSDTSTRAPLFIFGTSPRRTRLIEYI